MTSNDVLASSSAAACSVRIFAAKCGQSVMALISYCRSGYCSKLRITLPSRVGSASPARG